MLYGCLSTEGKGLSSGKRGRYVRNKPSACFRLDPPWALRRWAGGFRFVVSTTFLQKQGKRTFEYKGIFIAGVKFHRFLRSKMTAGLLAVKMGLRNVSGRFVATPESTAWDSIPPVFCRKAKQTFGLFLTKNFYVLIFLQSESAGGLPPALSFAFSFKYRFAPNPLTSVP